MSDTVSLLKFADALDLLLQILSRAPSKPCAASLICYEATLLLEGLFCNGDVRYAWRLFQNPDVLTTGAGGPIGDKLNIQTAGPRGPALMQDFVYMDEMAHFDRERIPERVVHAKGGGACHGGGRARFTGKIRSDSADKQRASFFGEIVIRKFVLFQVHLECWRSHTISPGTPRPRCSPMWARRPRPSCASPLSVRIFFL